MNKISTFLTILLLYFISAVPSQAQTELITNGDLEVGGAFGAWSTMDLGSGMFFISVPGTLGPVFGLPTPPNPNGGGFYAITDMGGPGTHVMYQSFTVPAGATSVNLSFEMFVNDWSLSGGIIDPIGLDHTGPVNQHARVDILNAGAAPLSTAPIDVVANYYIGVDPNNPNATLNPYVPYNINITADVTPGNTYILRFGETDNQGVLNMGVDNVSIIALDTPIPTLGQWGIIILGLMLIIVGVVKVTSRIYAPEKI